MRRMGRGDGGVTIVEASFALPIMFMFMFGLVDVGMWTYNSNQASNAARDGARAGLLAYPLPGLDLVGVEEDEARATIVSAIQDHLPDGTVGDSDVTIECLADDGSTLPCSDPDPDRVRVDVEWHWDLVTPIGVMIGVDEGVARGSATMEIVGRPVAGYDGPPPDTEDPLNPPAPDCALSDLSAPDRVSSKANQLTQPMVISFEYVSGDCNDLRVQLTGTKMNNAETVTHFCGCGDGPEHTWTYAGSNNIWQANGRKGVVTVLNGDTVLLNREFWVD